MQNQENLEGSAGKKTKRETSAQTSHTSPDPETAGKPKLLYRDWFYGHYGESWTETTCQFSSVTHTYTCTHTHTHERARAHTHIYARTNARARAHTHTHSHTNTHKHTSRERF